LTKQESAENTLKCQLSIDEASKVGLDVSKLIEDNVAALCNLQVFVEQEPKLKVARVMKKAYPKRIRLGRITQRLFNLESGNEPEKSLNIELDLYQMETY
jgi:hypothetical protein